MSFILDALKKSETERQRADSPALYEMKVAPPRQRVALWLIVLAALLVINILVLSVVLLRGNHGAAPAPDAGTSAAAPSVNPPAIAPPEAPPQAAAAPFSAPVAQAADSAAGTPAVPADDDTPAVDPSRGGPATANGEVPTYEQAANAAGANLPQLKLDLHAYASNPADRFVYLNMLNLKEGQTSPAGVRVESITPDGAILSWHGTKFFLHSQ